MTTPRTSAWARSSPLRSAEFSQAPGPIRYPPVNCQFAGRWAGVPVIPPELTAFRLVVFVSVALLRSALASVASLHEVSARLSPLKFALVSDAKPHDVPLRSAPVKSAEL